MRIFQIEGSSNSPWVWLDEKSGIIEITGVSAFHNPFQFYRCLARWIYAFNLGDHKTHVVNVKFEYLDEASVRGMELVLHQLYRLGKDNNSLTINWYYNKENTFIRKLGKQYSGQSLVPFFLVAA
jgi:hypothetical protein